ncbi:MAG: cupin domain-containing protein [Methanothrix sp.]
MFFSYSDARAVEMLPGLQRRTLVSDEKLMICRFDLEKGVEIPGHSHPHDQAGYVVSGEIRVTLEGQSRDLGPGDSYSAPSGAVHSALALEPSVVVDTFSPPRDDYL